MKRDFCPILFPLFLLLLTALTVGAQTTGSTGGSQYMGTEQPSLGLRYIMNTTGGLYPTSSTAPDAGEYPFLGEIRLFAGNFDPVGWESCDGRLISIAANSALFSLLGTFYGGDGSTTFALPDLRGRTPSQAGSGTGLSSYYLGEKFGFDGQSLSTGQLPIHNHTLPGGDTENTGASQTVNSRQASLALNGLINPYGNWDYLSEIRFFGGNFEPGNWEYLDGTLLSIPSYSALFSQLGIIYGGDGETTFALPDLRGRVPLHHGNGPGLSPRSLGQYFGTEDYPLFGINMASHNHTTSGPDTGYNGSTLSMNNMQPSLVIRYRIAVTGLYPTPSFEVVSDQPFIAEIRPFAGTWDPTGWVDCDGQLLAISSNTALFSLIGTTFGGDGVTTFALPDLRGRTPVGIGFGPGLQNRSWGQKFGTESVTMTLSTLPSHNHALGSRLPGNIPDGSGAGTPLTLSKNAGDPAMVDFLWGDSCGTASGYVLYEGALGDFTGHQIASGGCTIGTTSLSGHTPGGGDRYFLVAPIDSVMDTEGSLGTSSGGSQRSHPVTTCATTIDTSTCDP